MQAIGIALTGEYMQGQPEVSVIIPCHNAATTVTQQLEALSAQIDPPPFEVIVVDNRSTDDLAAALAPFSTSRTFTMRCVEASRHQGSSYARNVGVSHARASLLQFCDADDIVSRSWVRNGVLSTRAVGMWSGEATGVPDAVFRSGTSEVWKAFDDKPPAWHAPDKPQEGDLPVLLGGNFGITRSQFLRLGGFDQTFAHFGDDNDLAFRARRFGCEIPVATCVAIAFREKARFRQKLRIGFHAAQARQLLLEKHDAQGLSALAPWPIDLLRCAAATALAPIRRPRPDAEDILLRWAFALGNAAGSIRYRTLNRVPAGGLGEGLTGDSNDG